MLYANTAQLMTHAANVYMAAAYLAVMLLSLLAYSRGQLRTKFYLYHCMFERSKPIFIFSEKFVTKFSDLILNFLLFLVERVTI